MYSRLEMKSPPRYFLGEDGTLQHQNGEGVGDDSCDQQRQNHVDIVRQFNCEDNSRERGAHGAAENRSHADEWPKPGACRRKK